MCAPGQNYRIAELDLASRLSFFLWGTVPDAELVKVATAARSRRPPASRHRSSACLRIRDPKRSSTRFAAQWLRLQDLEKINPDALLFPYYDRTSPKRCAGRPSSSSTASFAKIAASSTC